mmetsp:Transcript_764/g.1381  ORF Transcript_764/g.1381 Transcript_764/m.1381 type:complete len:80 (-) Transcript_764:321-560(-)
MGSSASKQTTENEVVCIDCDKKTQKDLPSNKSSSASEGMPCEEVYAKVVACMDKHQGQVSPCTKEWDEFKKCHSDNSRR